MSRLPKIVISLFAILFAIVLFSGDSEVISAEVSTRSARPVGRSVSRPASVAKQEDPYLGKRVMVEVFVVEVKLEALYEQGVKPITLGEPPVSVETIVACLENGGAKVIAGAKVTSNHGSEASTNSQKVFQVEKKERSVQNKTNIIERITYDQYTSGLSLEVRPYIKPGGRIYLKSNFDLSLTSENKLNKVNYSYNGATTLNNHDSIIVESEQDEEKAVFTILCAHIQD